MKLLERVQGPNGVKIIIGSAFFWAWLDALFMSAFFIQPKAGMFMPEAAAISVFFFSVPVFIGALVKPHFFINLLAKRKIILIAAGLGCGGSLLFFFSGTSLEWAFLILGGLLGGAFMGFFQMGWGAAYCYDGARSAAPFAAGGFAGAIIIDTPLLFMIPEAASVFYALFPLITGLIFISIKPEQRTYLFNVAASSSHPKSGFRAHLKTHLGISSTLFCAVTLVMIGFGYLQHLVSFSSIASNGVPSGTIIQLARGVTAVLLFMVVVFASQRASVVYRVGLLAMIAGFMMMSFLFGTGFFWISGAIIMAGYTTFDLFVWIAFSQIARTQSRSPLKTIAVMRLVSVACYVAGAAIGVILSEANTTQEFMSAETTVIGYLVVIATVLLLGGEDMWAPFGRHLAPSTLGEDRTNLEERLRGWFDDIKLTSREREIAILLAYGRTQPWIAQHLCISENTVGTHVRHIYQKSNVHNRQEFIDFIVLPDQPSSRETREEGVAIMKDT